MLYIVGYWHLFNYTGAFPGYANAFTGSVTEIVLGLFSTVSGFLIGLTARDSDNVITFYKKRLIRIYPLYVVAIVLFFVYGLNDAATSIKSMVFLSMYYGPTPATLWFVTMLMLFYLVTPVLLKIIQSPKKLLVAVLGVFAITLLLQAAFESVDIRILYYFPCYSLGLYCARYGIRTKIVNVISAVTLIFFWILLSLIDIDSLMFNELRNVPKILGFSYLVFSASCIYEKKFKRFFVISVLSYSSYAMYLFHRPIYATLQSIYFPETGPNQVLYLMTAGLLTVLFVSWGAQRLYDTIYVKAASKA